MHLLNLLKARAKILILNLRKRKLENKNKNAIINALKNIDGTYNNWDKFETK